MKRKVIKQGNNTLTITLPRDWTSKFGVKVGDELELEERGRQLLVGSSSTAAIDKIQIDTANMNERVLRWVLSAAHKSGYDEIELLHQTPEQLKVIHELVKDLYMGFSVVEQTANRCLLKSISKEVASEFDTVLRRAFLVALSMADSTLEMLRKGDYENLSGLVALEHSNNQLTNFCERIINKIGHGNYKKNSFYYVIAWNLEKICDNYKYICDYFTGRKLKIKPEVLDLLQKANSFFRSYYEIFYSHDINKLSKLAEQGKSLMKETTAMSKTAKNEADFVVLSSVMQIVLQAMDFSASYVAVNGFKE